MLFDVDNEDFDTIIVTFKSFFELYFLGMKAALTFLCMEIQKSRLPINPFIMYFCLVQSWSQAGWYQLSVGESRVHPGQVANPHKER